MMAPHPIFLSLVIVGRNLGLELESILQGASAQCNGLSEEYEIIFVDNASTDHSLDILESLTGHDGLPNLQVYALTKEVTHDTAAWVGLENALGDFVAVVDPLTDSIEFLPQLLEKAVKGADVVFAHNREKKSQSLIYRTAFVTFNLCYKALNGVHLAKEAPSYRLLSKRVINFILQHPQPSLSYRHLPATAGFTKSTLEYSTPTLPGPPKPLIEDIDRGMRLLVSTTHAPMRLVTLLSLFGAGANVLYSLYVLAIALLKTDVEPGWISLSLQQSGMFFLLSLVLFVLGEYILQVATLSNEGPRYHIGRELTSKRLTRKEKLNIESSSESPLQPHSASSKG